MRKLLRADFSRLFRDKVFLASCALMFFAGGGFPVIHFFDNMKNGERWMPDYAFFAFGLFVPILLSFVTALFIGSGYSDGAVRNKLIVGHLRRDIYLSGLIVCSAAAFMAALICLLSLRSSLREAARELDDKLMTDTNTLISISSGDREMRAFAARINIQLQALREERLKLQYGDMELKSAVMNISHDLRTPLTAICGYLDLLEREPLPERPARYITVIRERSDAM